MSYTSLSILCGFLFVLSTILIFTTVAISGQKINLKITIEELKNRVQDLQFDKQDADIEIADLKEKLALHGVNSKIDLDYTPSEYMDMNSALISFLGHLGYHYKGKARSLYDLQAGVDKDFFVMVSTSTMYVYEDGYWVAYPYKTFITIKEKNK